MQELCEHLERLLADQNPAVQGAGLLAAGRWVAVHGPTVVATASTPDEVAAPRQLAKAILESAFLVAAQMDGHLELVAASIADALTAFGSDSIVEISCMLSLAVVRTVQQERPVEPTLHALNVALGILVKVDFVDYVDLLRASLLDVAGLVTAQAVMLAAYPAVVEFLACCTAFLLPTPLPNQYAEHVVPACFHIVCGGFSYEWPYSTVEAHCGVELPTPMQLAVVLAHITERDPRFTSLQNEQGLPFPAMVGCVVRRLLGHSPDEHVAEPGLCELTQGSVLPDGSQGVPRILASVILIEALATLARADALIPVRDPVCVLAANRGGLPPRAAWPLLRALVAMLQVFGPADTELAALVVGMCTDCLRARSDWVGERLTIMVAAITLVLAGPQEALSGLPQLLEILASRLLVPRRALAPAQPVARKRVPPDSEVSGQRVPDGGSDTQFEAARKRWKLRGLSGISEEQARLTLQNAVERFAPAALQQLPSSVARLMHGVCDELV